MLLYQEVSSENSVVDEDFFSSVLLFIELICCSYFPGMDTQFVMRPFLDKVEERTRACVLRKIQYPHVSVAPCPKAFAICT